MMEAYHTVVVQGKPVEPQPEGKVAEHSHAHRMDSAMEHDDHISVHIHGHSSDEEQPENREQHAHNLGFAADYSCNWTEFVVDRELEQEKGQEHVQA